MKMVQVRFGMGRDLDEYGSPDELWSSDRFVTESEAKELVRVYGSARVIDEKEVDIVLADKFDPDAPPLYWGPFERAAILRVARPKEPARGYPRDMTTILVDGVPHNVGFKIVPALDSYDCPSWGIDSSQRFRIVKAAVAMYDGSGGGIGDLKRAVKKFVKKKYRIYKMGSRESHITYWPSLFETPDDAAKWAAEKDLAADLGLHEYLAVQDETTEKIVKYL